MPLTRSRITGLALGALTVAAIAGGVVLAGGDSSQLTRSAGADDLVAAAAQVTPAPTPGSEQATGGGSSSKQEASSGAASKADAQASKAAAEGGAAGGGGGTDPGAEAARSQTPGAQGSSAQADRAPAATPKPTPRPTGLRLDGPKLPSVTATSTAGTVDFGSLRGPAVIHVYASWCPTCRAEAPGFGRALKKAPGVKPIYLAVADEPADSAAFVTRYGWRSAPRIDDPSRELATKLGVDYQPNLILVDRDGRTRVLAGGLAEAKLTAVLQALEA